MNQLLNRNLPHLSLVLFCLIFFPIPTCLAATVHAAITPAALRCNYFVRPMGLQSVHPRLAWQLRADRRGLIDARQTAYQILVATSQAHLQANHGDLWNSGKVLSNQSIDIRYAGRPLVAGQRCWWKVRVWGATGHASAWSKPALWTMGLLHKNNWLAHWIVAPQAASSQPMRDLSWVWLPGVGTHAPVGNAYFRKIVNLPAVQTISKATFNVTADNEFQLFINGKFVGKGMHWRQMQHLNVLPLLRHGRNILAVKGTNTGSSPNPAGLLGMLCLTWSNGRTQIIPVDRTWKISSVLTRGWKSAKFNDSGWRHAQAVAFYGGGPWGKINTASGRLPLFRHSFAVAKPIAHAVVYISGLGQYDLFVNGHKIGHDVMQPAWTDYRKVVDYNTYALTKQLRQGANVLAVMLGTGMYDSADYPGRYNHAPAGFGPPKLILQAHITFADGTTHNIVSNGQWRTAPGPITFCNIFGGEDYNAIDSVPGWKLPGFNDAGWRHALAVRGPGGGLVAQTAPPVKVMHVYKAIHILHPQPGVTVYDLGQNMAGRPVITARGPAGSTLTLYPSELIHKNGMNWQSCAGPIWCTYTLSGKGVETFHPMFSYFGFRYVQVNAAPAPNSSQLPVVLAVTGQATHTSAPVIGSFSCSNNLINQIHHLITMAMANNMVSIVTDCPTREKSGWLEDTYLVGPGIMDNFFVPDLYAQTAANMRSDQNANGHVADIAPVYFNYSGGFVDSPEWGSASIIDPWLIYRHFDDKGILAANYNMMRHYAAYLKSRAKDNLLFFGLGDWYDLGPNAPGYEQLTSLGVTATATWYRDLKIMTRIARLLGHSAQARAYAAQAAKVRLAFNRRFYHPSTGQYDRGSQCANAMALATGLARKTDRKRVLASLIANIHKHGNHTTAGDIGFHYVVQALTNAHKAALLYKMATQTTPPSYGYQIAHGATALTEAWNALPQDSQDHFMLGHIDQWFYNGLAGIHLNFANKPGRQLEIRPSMVGNLTWVHSSYDSVLGKIVSNWHRTGAKCTMDITIPANTMATIYIPHTGASPVLLNGSPLAKRYAVIVRGQRANRMICRLPSGVYHFSSHYRPHSISHN